MYLRMTDAHSLVFNGRAAGGNSVTYLLKIKCHSNVIEKNFFELPDGLYVLFYLRNDNHGYIMFKDTFIINVNAIVPFILEGKFIHIYDIDNGIRLECSGFHIEKRG